MLDTSRRLVAEVRAEKAEARVAELEAELDRRPVMISHKHPDLEPGCAVQLVVSGSVPLYTGDDLENWCAGEIIGVLPWTDESKEDMSGQQVGPMAQFSRAERKGLVARAESAEARVAELEDELAELRSARDRAASDEGMDTIELKLADGSTFVGYGTASRSDSIAYKGKGGGS